MSGAMQRRQFTFFESFRQAIDYISDAGARLRAYEVLCDYALYGREPDPAALPEAAAVFFSLVRPTLDASRRKAESGAKGGLKGGEARSKQGASEKENETEKETEDEKETELETEKEMEKDPFSQDDTLGRPERLPAGGAPVEGAASTSAAPSAPSSSSVIEDFVNRINPTPSKTCLAELEGFAGDLGEALCRRAFDIAVDNHNASWRYVRGILRNWRDRGVRSPAELEQADRRPPAHRRCTGPPPATAGQLPLGDYEQGALEKMLNDMKGGVP